MLVKLLRSCCVQVMGTRPGCGFFIAPKLVVTCAHVVGRELQNGSTVQLRQWTNEDVHTLEPPATLIGIYPDDDIALLSTTVENPTFAPLSGEASIGNELVGVGFPKRGDREEFTQFLARFEGPTQFLDTSGRAGVEAKFKAGQVEPGYSGGPLLNLHTGRVMGVVVATRDRHTDLGGWAIELDVLLKLLKDRQIQLPTIDQKWLEAGTRVSKRSGLIDFTQERLRHGKVLGRDAVFATVDKWFEEYRSGWVLIKGGPGTGKSAIVTALLDRLEEKHGQGSVPHHFLRRGQATWNEPDAIVRNLSVRLENLVEADLRADMQGLERFQNLLAQAVKQDPLESGQLTIAIDGLDEATKQSSDDRVLPRFLPEYLPDGVWLLCASRPNYPELGWLEQRSGLHTIDLDQEPWLENNMRIVEAYWRNKGPQLKPPLDGELLEASIKAAQGNILYAVTLYDAFDVNPQFRNPERLPRGFAALLEDIWRRIVEMDDRETSKHVIDGLGLLAIAGEALPLSIVARLLGWEHPVDIANFKRHALPFLLEEHADWHGGEARYRPFHEANRKFLTSGDHMWPQVRRNIHKLLAERLAAWLPDDEADIFNSEYAARYALVHLSATGDSGRIAELLKDLRYSVAALKALGPQLFLSRILALPPQDEQPELTECAEILARVLRLESQWLETYPDELPSLIHNRLLCLGWIRDQIQARFSGFDHGWGLINAVDIGDEICIFRGHFSSVQTCDLDEKGRYGVSGGWDGRVRLWDLDRGTNLHVFRPDSEAERCDIVSCAISADGRYIVAASVLIRLDPRKQYSRVQVWDTLDRQVLVDLDPTGIKVAFAGNDKAIACSVSGQIDIHDIKNSTTRKLDIGEAITGGIDLDNSGRLLATVTEKGCTVWKISNGKKLCQVDLIGAEKCSFSPDGRSIAVAKYGNVIVASSVDGSTLQQTDVINQISDCRLLPNGRLLFTSDWDCEVVVWDMDTDRAVDRYQGHTYTANCCAVTSDGRYALTGGGDNIVRLWSLNEKAISLQVDRHEKLVYGCTVNSEGTLACSAPQGALPVLWNAQTGRRIREIDSYVSYGYVRFIRVGEGDHRLVTLGSTLQVWDPRGEQPEWELEIPVDPTIGGIRFTSDIAYVKSDLFPLLRTDSHILVWNKSETLKAIAIAEKSAISRFNGGRAITSLNSGGELEIIDLNAPKTRTIIADGVRSCIGSPKEYAVYALMSNNQLCRLDANSGEVQVRLGEIHQEYVSLFVDGQEQALWALCHDGGVGFASASLTNESLMAFSLDGSGVFQIIKVPGHDVMKKCFFRDGRFVTAGWDATIRVWDVGHSKAIAAISGSAPFRCVDVADDRIVAGDQKGDMWFLAPFGELYQKP